MPVRPWEMERLTPAEEALIVAHHNGNGQQGQETHSSLTEAVRKGW
jgi:hypothetical protein